MRKILSIPLTDLVACLEQLATLRRPGRALGVTIVSLVVTWFVYVPCHELLHAWGCVLAGGSISQLEIAPQYGGALLSRWFPFVVSGGEYAGRLSGFDTKGSDVIYLITDFMPYLLTVFAGVALIKLAMRRPRPFFLGAGTVIGLAPFYNLIGDYFEMGSIVTTRLVTSLLGRETIVFESLRSDDVFKLIGEVFSEPASLGLAGWGDLVRASIVILASGLVGLVLSIVTYLLGHFFAVHILRIGLGAPRASTE